MIMAWYISLYFLQHLTALLSKMRAVEGQKPKDVAMYQLFFNLHRDIPSRHQNGPSLSPDEVSQFPPAPPSSPAGGTYL